MTANKFLNKIQIIILAASTLILTSCSGNGGYLPGALNGMVLKKAVTGAEATKDVDKLHFNPVASDKENEIGFYESADNKGTVYVTYYKSKEEAKADFEKMTRKISPQNSVFISPSFFEFQGYNIYRCFGMGQSHFVFVHKKALLWISADTVHGKEVLKDYLAAIN